MSMLAVRTLARRGNSLCWKLVVLDKRTNHRMDTARIRRNLSSCTRPRRHGRGSTVPAWVISIGGLGYLASSIGCTRAAAAAFVSLSMPSTEQFVCLEPPIGTDDDALHSVARLLSEQLSSLWESIMMTVRAVRLFLTFAPLVCLSPVCLVPGADRIWWSLLLCSIECSGPIFMKLGQWASTRRDLFSADFCDRFARLQRSVKPHSWRLTCRRLDEAFGATNWKRLIHFDDVVPIGSGCVAQVYRAFLRMDLLETRNSRTQPIDVHRRPQDFVTIFAQGTTDVSRKSCCDCCPFYATVI